jgi:hypothetical protein
LDSSLLPFLTCVRQHTFKYTLARINSSLNIACASNALLLPSLFVHFEPILSTFEAWVVVVESKRQHGVIYIRQKNAKQSMVLQGNDAALVSLWICSPRVLKYVTYVAIAMHSRFLDRRLSQGKRMTYRFSVDNALCLKTIVHFYSYTRCILQAWEMIIEYPSSDTET